MLNFHVNTGHFNGVLCPSEKVRKADFSAYSRTVAWIISTLILQEGQQRKDLIAGSWEIKVILLLSTVDILVISSAEICQGWMLFYASLSMFSVLLFLWNVVCFLVVFWGFFFPFAGQENGTKKVS